MFKISQSQTFSWPVRVEIPVSGGKHDVQPFDAEFKRLSQSRIKEIRNQANEGSITDLEACREILVGWKDVMGDDGTEVPFSAENREKLLEVAGVARAIVVAFFESLNGAKTKN